MCVIWVKVYNTGNVFVDLSCSAGGLEMVMAQDVENLV